MQRRLFLVFGILVYLLFLVTFLYQIGFVSDRWVPKAINDGPVIDRLHAAAIDVGLLAIFAIQHTIMARISFKRWWTTIVPAPIERSIFVLLASLILLFMNWQWRPLPEVVWQVDNNVARIAIWSVAAVGWGLVLYSTFLINHFDLFGLRQVWLAYNNIEYTQVHFKESVLYHWVRHPLMLGFLIAFWATPTMTEGHLLFAGVVTIYVLLAIRIEERTLVALHGDDYRRYQERVSMILPLPPKQAKVTV